MVTLASVSAIVRADEVWTITSSDFVEERGALVGITNAGVTFRSATGEDFERKWESVLEISRSVQRPGIPEGVWVAILRGGQRIIGQPAALGDDSVTWTTTLGEFTLPVSELIAITRGSEVAAATSDPPSQDTIQLANGDVVSGIMESLSADSVAVTGSPAVAWDSVSMVRFAGVDGPRATPERLFVVRLVGGSVLAAEQLEQADGRLQFSRDGQARSVPLASVVSIEQRNGPVRWLTDLQPAEEIVRPYFGTVGAEIVTSDGYENESSSEADSSPRTAIYMPSYSRLDYAVDPACQVFRTSFLISSDRPHANCVVRIKLDGKVAYELANVSTSTPPQTVVLPLQRMKALSIEVDYGKTYDVQDQVTFVDAAFLTNAPASTTQSAR